MRLPMRRTARRRLRVAGLTAGLTAASALAVAVVGNSAGAATAGAAPAIRPTFTGPPPTPHVVEGTYTWRNVNSRSCLGDDPNAPYVAWQYDCHADAGDGHTVEHSEDYQWHTVNVGDNEFELINMKTKQCLSIYRSAVEENMPIRLDDCQGFGSQVFTAVLQPGRPSSYHLVNLNSLKCVAVDRGLTDNGALMLQRTCSTDPAQAWSPFVLTVG